MAVNGNRKGKVGEREVANILKERGHGARRGQQYEGSSDSPDVVTDLHGAFADVHLEVKRTEKGNLYHWLAQANTDAELTKTPVVVHRRNGEKWVAIMDLRDFITLMEKCYVGRNSEQN